MANFVHQFKVRIVSYQNVCVIDGCIQYRHRQHDNKWKVFHLPQVPEIKRFLNNINAQETPASNHIFSPFEQNQNILYNIYIEQPSCTNTFEVLPF